MISIAYESFVNDTDMELFGLSKKEKELKAARQKAARQKAADEFHHKMEICDKIIKDKSKINVINKN